MPSRKVCFYGSLIEHSYFCGISDRGRQSVPFSCTCRRESSISEFCSGTRYVKRVGVVADCSRLRPGNVEILVVASAMQDGVVVVVGVQVWTAYITRQSL